MKRDALSNQLITFTRCFYQTLPVEYRDLPPAALDQTCLFQLPSRIRDGWPVDTQHFGEEIVGNRQRDVVTAVTHHEEPTSEPLLEAVGAIAGDRHQDLFKKGLDVSIHEIPERRHRPHGPCERGPRHLCCAARDLDQKPDGGTPGTKDGLHTAATLTADRCHFYDTAVRINRNYRNDPAIGEEDILERTVSVQENLRALAANVFKVRHEPREIPGWQGKQEPIAGPI
jgi:hypothetical protein